MYTVPIITSEQISIKLNDESMCTCKCIVVLPYSQASYETQTV